MRDGREASMHGYVPITPDQEDTPDVDTGQAWQPLPPLPAGYFQTPEKLVTRRGVLWLGQTCNIRCHFCYFLDRIEDKNHPEHPFMELEKAKQICHDLRYRYGNTSIDIQGGEPTIWRH